MYVQLIYIYTHTLFFFETNLFEFIKKNIFRTQSGSPFVCVYVETAVCNDWLIHGPHCTLKKTIHSLDVILLANVYKNWIFEDQANIDF